MTEKPILFSGEMVKAILSGNKTQTRRVLNPQPPEKVATGSPVVSVDSPSASWTLKGHENHWGVRGADGIASSWSVRCPYGKVGDQLWVRETHCFVADGPLAIRPGVAYAADKQIVWCDTLPDGVTVYNAEKPDVWKWHPSIHMPRWASRITLEIVSVRLERLQDISEADAMAEGMPAECPNWIPCPRCQGNGLYSWAGADGSGLCEVDCGECNTYRKRFVHLWDSINAKRGYGWAVNPWVWAVEFKRIEANNG